MICATIAHEFKPSTLTTGASILITVQYPKWAMPDFMRALDPSYMTDVTGASMWSYLEIPGVVIGALNEAAGVWLMQTQMCTRRSEPVGDTQLVIRVAKVGGEKREEVVVMSQATWEQCRGWTE